MVDAATFLEALNSPPGNRLEALKGDLAGKHSIRINDQWRIVFRWTDAGPEDMEIIDYRSYCVSEIRIISTHQSTSS